MKLVTWDSKLVDFLSGYNTVLVEKQNFAKFITKMEAVGLDASGLKSVSDSIGDLLIEYKNDKGFAYWNMLDANNQTKDDLNTAIKRSITWYGVEPLKLEEIL